MNYFEFYEIPLSFNIDEAALRTKYYQLSKQYHPDFFIGTSEEIQLDMLEKSTLNNKAFKTLGSFPGRVKYILQLNGLLEEGDKHLLPPDFLMEMMDINEALLELETDAGAPKLKAIREQIEGYELENSETMKNYSLVYDAAADDSQRKTTLEHIRELYHKSKYLLRLRESLNKFAD